MTPTVYFNPISPVTLQYRATPLFGSRNPETGLTDTELEVLTLIAAGLNLSEIGTRLGKSKKTVANQLHMARYEQNLKSNHAKILQSVSTHPAMVAVLFHHGILDPQDPQLNTPAFRTARQQITRLTETELELLYHLSQIYRQPDVSSVHRYLGKQANKAKKTAQNQAYEMMAKLGIKTQAGLVTLAWQVGPGRLKTSLDLLGTLPNDRNRQAVFSLLKQYLCQFDPRAFETYCQLIAEEQQAWRLKSTRS